MEPRFNLFDSPTVAKIAKRMHAASLLFEESTLPKALREAWRRSAPTSQRLRLLRRHPHQGGQRGR